MSHSVNRRSNRVVGLVAAASIILLCVGCWNPRMVHPYTYATGRVAKPGQAALSGQMLPGAWMGGSAGVSLGKGFALEGTYGYTGEDVFGGGFELTRSIIEAKPRYVSFTAGADWFNNNEHDYDGYRVFFGPTLSIYPGGRKLGVHIPLRAYYMDYQWGIGWNEGTTSEISEASGVKWFGVAGVGLSFDYSRLTLQAAMNVPTVKWIDEVEIYPYIGARVSLRLGKVEKRVKPPDEFSSR